MPRRKPEISIANYGRYTTWDKRSRDLPRLIKYTDTIEAINGNEFGITISVDNLKGKALEFQIKHPPIRNEIGNLLPNFRGKLFVKTNHTQFFVGDGIWLPVSDKIGEWEVVIYYDSKVVISKKFNIIEADKKE